MSADAMTDNVTVLPGAAGGTPPASPTRTPSNYLNLDVSPGSAIDRALQDGAGEEHASSSGRIRLTDDFSPDPAGLTPRMRAWWITHVAGPRGRALSAMKGAFESDTLPGGRARGIFAEAEMDQCAQKKREGQLVAYNRFEQLHGPDVTARDQALREYEEMKAVHGGRDAKRLNQAVYWAGLAVIVLVEFLLNFASVQSVSYLSAPVFAGAMTLLIAVAIATAGHFHGVVWRQWGYWFGPEDPHRPMKAARMLAVGGLCLSVALGVMAYARYSYIIPAIEAAVLRGVAPPSLAVSMVSLLLPNIIVYLISFAWAFLLHDEDPEYADKALALDKAESRVKAARGKVLIAEFGRLDQVHLLAKKRCEAVDGQQRMAPNYSANCTALGDLKEKDDEVRGALERYRATLVGRMRQRGQEPVFELRRLDAETGSKYEALDAEAFLAGGLRLKMIGATAA